MNKPLSYIVLLAVFLFYACSNDTPEVPQTPESRMLLSFNFEQETVVKFRQGQAVTRSQASGTEKALTDLYVYLLDASGNIVFDSPYIFRTAGQTGHNPAEWEDANTVIINKSPMDVRVKTVYVIANVESKPALKTALTNPLLNNLAGLRDAVYQSASLNNEIPASNFLMDGHTDSHDFAANRKVHVDLRRAVAKLEVNVYFNWDKLSSLYDNYARISDVGRDTWALQHTTLLTGSNRTSYAEKMLPKGTDRVGPVTMTAYINEYNQGSNAANTPPYVLLKLWAHYEQTSETPPVGTYPPPAGGVVDPAKDITTFYRLLLPREMKRNTHYVIDAHILQLGGPSADNALTLNPEVTVKPWDDPINI